MIFYGPAKSLLSLFLPFVEDFTVDKMIIDTKTRPPFYHTSTRDRYVDAEKTSQLSSVHAQRYFYVSTNRVCKLIMAVMTENASSFICLGLFLGNLSYITLKLLNKRADFKNESSQICKNLSLCDLCFLISENMDEFTWSKISRL